MIVDDDTSIRAILAEQLREAGLQVVEATSADAAWTYLLAGASGDVIFIDIRMPGSMDGVELALRAKDEYPDIPVILTREPPRHHPSMIIVSLASPTTFHTWHRS